MTLLDEIIEAASDDKIPIGSLLRKCLILERQLRNEKFRVWLDLELDGYDAVSREELPEYRLFSCTNRGDFLGNRVQATAQPISLHMMTEEEQDMMRFVELKQPAAAYAHSDGNFQNAMIPWNQSLVVKYQSKIYRGGDPVLVKAWQEIPGSVLAGLLDQVRTRVLRFALDVKESLPLDAENAAGLPAAAIEKAVVNNFYGGNNFIATNTVSATQAVQQHIAQNDLPALLNALQELGISPSGAHELTLALEHKEPEKKNEGLKKWAADMGTHVVKEGAKVGLEVAKQTALRLISQYLGHTL